MDLVEMRGSSLREALWGEIARYSMKLNINATYVMNSVIIDGYAPGNSVMMF